MKHSKNIMIFFLSAAAIIFNYADLSAQKKQLTYKQVFESGGMRGMMGFSRAINWLDDEHYIEMKADPAKPGSRPVPMKTNVKDGSSVPLVDNSKVELPEGFSIDRPSGLSKDYNYYLFNSKNNLYYYSRPDNTFKQLTKDDAEEKVPQLSPDGKKAAYVKGNNLYVFDIEKERETQLTTDGAELIYNGWASWVYMEEILGRATAHSAFWWSPQSDKICFLRFDDSPVPEFPIYHADGQHGKLERQRYPKAGDPNPYVKFGVANIADGKITWADFDEKADHYIAWPFWTKDNRLTVQWMNRAQDNIIIYWIDTNSGKKTELYNEKQNEWVEWFEDLYFFENKTGFLLRSNVDGWDHLYYYDLNGKLKKRLTQGDWQVTNTVLVDETSKKVYFHTPLKNSTDRYLCVVDLDGKNFKQLTTTPGQHTASVSPKAKYYIDSYSNITTPAKSELYSINGKLIRTISDANSAQYDEYAMAKPELFSIPTEDGFELPAVWWLPANFDPNKKHAVIISIYGGPNSSSVRNSYSSGLSQSYFAQQGIISVSVDHRGSGHFGKKGQAYMHRCLGKWEINDYSAAVKWLKTKSFIDSTRIGIIGGSYGGYVVALALTKAADLFTHGIAEYGVMDWKLYDNVYTERYMDTPAENPEGYKAGSVFNYIDNYKGNLLITHGTTDDNVHLQNSIQLVTELQKRNKDFEMMFYPNFRHGIGLPHVTKVKNQFWFKHLLGRELDVTKD
ncbi:MAG: Dipeptidyl-peptidase 4 [Ignavibacteria bacterium]|nr:MAG: Dipeptidyl-peptidase 4 [Ignavibacteria bacterium]KAF0159117.1 MAG: Dipeptidyl-peptidase 4 [Ignavibacteria bacterium]